jgi:hypothetical protein
MGRMLVLLCDSSYHHESVDHVIELTITAIGKSLVVLETIKLSGKKLKL